MRGVPTNFWGKLERDEQNRVSGWHPLVDHCADVAAVTEVLLSLPVWQSRLSRLAAVPLTPVMYGRLSVLSALHDIGKFNSGFQAKGNEHSGPVAGHVTEAIGALCKPVFAALAILNDWGDSVTELMITSLCHHGRPHGYDDAAALWQQSHWLPRKGLDPRIGLEALLDACRRWFPQAFCPGGDPLPESPAFAHTFAGVVMLADWLGSDQRFFPFTREGDGDRMTFSRGRALDAIDGMWLRIPLSHRVDRRGRDAFSRIAPPQCSPRPAQAALASLPMDSLGSLTILESETGSGKTEAALARFAALFVEGLVDGLYFALPTRTAATQIHRRIHAATQQAFDPPPPVLLAVPGYLRVDDTDGMKLAPFEVQWSEHEDERWRYRSWAGENSKRYMAGAIIVGTVDQVLLSSLMVGHAHLRAASLLRHLLVIDEVHASDAYMTRILDDVLARHLAAGGHALLLSATLGGEARARLLRPGGRVQTPSLQQAASTPYPLISHRGSVEDARAVSSDGPGRSIAITVSRALDDPAAIATAALAAAQRGAKVLVIRNTVGACVATQLAAEEEAKVRHVDDLLFRCNTVPTPHHARYARTDREALDRALHERIGRNRAAGGCVVVATQTVQQSLDLDADLLFSDLCPADVLLQRLGRLHRHQRPRPPGFEQPRAYVLVPVDRDLGLMLSGSGQVRGRHGLGTVYADLRILEATWRLIERHQEWRIPEMNRHLVEHSLHSTTLDMIVHEGDALWQAHATEMSGRLYGHTRLADLNIADWSRPYAHTSFPPRGERRIPTRLGESDRRARFRSPFVSPFGEHVSEVTLQAAWVQDALSDVEFAETSANTEERTTFTFGERPFVYDRLGVRPASTRTEDADDDGA